MTSLLPVKKGLSSPAVVAIPDKWDKQWFRNFITNFLVNADIRNVSGLDVQGNVSGNNTSGGSTSVTISPFSATQAGTVPASGGGSTNLLHADGTWGPASGGSVTPGGSNTDIQFNNSGTFSGSNNLTWNGSTLAVSGTIQGTTLNSTSDPNMKTDIDKIYDSEFILQNINGYRFKWKESGKPSMGVLSNEIRKVAPELVSRINDHDAVNYNGLVAILIEEVKSLTQRVRELECQAEYKQQE